MNIQKKILVLTLGLLCGANARAMDNLSSDSDNDEAPIVSTHTPIVSINQNNLIEHIKNGEITKQDAKGIAIKALCQYYNRPIAEAQACLNEALVQGIRGQVSPNFIYINNPGFSLFVYAIIAGKDPNESMNSLPPMFVEKHDKEVYGPTPFNKYFTNSFRTNGTEPAPETGLALSRRADVNTEITIPFLIKYYKAMITEKTAKGSFFWKNKSLLFEESSYNGSLLSDKEKERRKIIIQKLIDNEMLSIHPDKGKKYMVQEKLQFLSELRNNGVEVDTEKQINFIVGL